MRKVGETGMSEVTPGVDFVRVVRCQDCEHGIEGTWSFKESKVIHIRCEDGAVHSPDWFCADGRKRDDSE